MKIGFHDGANRIFVEGASGEPGGIVIGVDHFDEFEGGDVEFDMDIAELMGGDFETSVMIEIDGNEMDLGELPSLEIIKEMVEKLQSGMRQGEFDEVLLNKSGDDSPKKANKKKANKKKADKKKADKKKADKKKADKKKANNKKVDKKKANKKKANNKKANNKKADKKKSPRSGEFRRAKNENPSERTQSPGCSCSLAKQLTWRLFFH